METTNRFNKLVNNPFPNAMRTGHVDLLLFSQFHHGREHRDPNQRTLHKLADTNEYFITNVGTLPNGRARSRQY